MKATRALQIVEAAKIPYELRAYEPDGFAPATVVAEKLSVPFEALFKTLVARGEHMGVVFVLMPSNKTLSLRKLAHAMGDKRAEMVDVGELPRLTGYIKGGVSPLGARKNYPVYLEESALAQPRIGFSAGQRGMTIIMDTQQFIALAKATPADLAE